MASSASNQQQHLPNTYNATSAPPPTPSAQPNCHLVTSEAAADELSRLLHRLPPTLSLPTRRFPTAPCPPLISLSDPTLTTDLLLSSSSQHGFFQLTDHDIPSQLANSAELESLSLFELAEDKKESYFPKNWPLGFDSDDDDQEGNGGESFWLNSACSTESTELGLASLRELTRALEKLGLEIIEMLSNAVGFENPLRLDPTRFSSLMVVHEGSHGDKPVISGGCYPYIVGLQYQIRCQKHYLLADSGWVMALPQADSVLVTIGDIAQVWSNGILKKIRGRPVAILGDSKKSRCISMSLLVTLPTESRVSPLLPRTIIGGNASENEISEEDEQNHGSIVKKEEKLFRSFSFEDYAWRVFHEPIFFKDPLDRYRI